MTEPVSSSEPNQPDVATRIAELEGQVALLKDTVLRSNADQQNQQRRHHREGIELRKFATAGLLEDLLPALDSLSLGLDSAAKQTDGRAVDEGFRIDLRKLRSILSGQGLVEISPVGQPFDPSRHEAVGSEPSADIAEGTVLRVARSGWLLHDRVVRPAAVFVSAGAAK
jgi:molecular chaperone GrpE